YDLSDEDVGAIIAFLKTQEPGEVQLPDRNVGPLGRLLLFYYKQIVGTILAAEKIDHDTPRIASARDEPAAHGRYLAYTICTECHGFDLRGEAGVGAPDLAIAVAYTLENFHKLLRTGVPMDGRELGLMAKMATNRFSHFSDGEVDALHTYLQTLATMPIER
ncbi:MAG: cytochrome c, partial [Gammaproteobacteria bacterium]|nr:cytochrome c [Gammaproteobacteria bacterium]